MKKQRGPLFSTRKNGSPSWYVTAYRFTFLSVEKTLAGTIGISNNILTWYWRFFKYVNPLTKRQTKGICLIFRRKIAHLAHRRALWTLVIASAERLKCLFVQTKFTRTLCFPTIHVPSGNNSAIVTHKIRGECATDRKCSPLFHTCLQRNISSSRNGDFRDG